MDGNGRALLVIVRNACGRRLGAGASQLEVQRNEDLHPAVIIAHHRHKGRGVGEAADLLHLGQMLMGEAQAVALGRIQLAVSRTVGALVLGDHLLAAAGVSRNAGAAERIVRRGQPQLHQRPRDADKAAGIAAGDRHTIRIFDFLFLALQLREAVVPGRVGAEGRGGIQHLDVRAEQRHDLFGGRIGQAEEGKVGRIDDLRPLVHILAALSRDAQQLDVRPGGQTVGNAQTGGAGRTVDKDFYAHAFAASHAPSWALASSICFLTLASLGPP